MMPVSPLLIPIIAMMIPLILVPTALILKQRQRRRELEHLERLAAIERGLPSSAGQSRSFWLTVAAIGAGVPFFAIACAFLGGLAYAPDETAEAAWVAATLISIGAFITSGSLVWMHNKALERACEREHLAQSRKPVYDPDEFDVVSSRG